MKKTSYKVALGGVISALSLVSMFMSSVIPTAEYAIPAFAGMLLIVLVIEINLKWAFATYICVSILSLLIVPNREASLLFVVFMGYYPIVKSIIESKIKTFVSWLVKLGVFNVALVAYYTLIKYLVASSDLLDSFDEYEKYIIVLLGVAANVVFVIYDIAMTNVISMYMNWLRKKISRYIK